MSRRHDPRAMNPHAYDPWRHNRVVARRRDYRRWARAVVDASRQFRAFNRAVTNAAAAMRELRSMPPKRLYATAEDLAALRRTYLGNEDDE